MATMPTHEHTDAYNHLRAIAQSVRASTGIKRLYLTTDEAALLGELDRSEVWLWHHTIAVEFAVTVDDEKARAQRERSRR